MNLKEQIERFAEEAFESGVNVEIERGLPSVAIYNDFERVDGYYFQEHEAEKLLKEVDKLAQDLDVTPEQYLAWSVQNW